MKKSYLCSICGRVYENEILHYQDHLQLHEFSIKMVMAAPKTIVLKNINLSDKNCDGIK